MSDDNVDFATLLVRRWLHEANAGAALLRCDHRASEDHSNSEDQGDIEVVVHEVRKHLQRMRSMLRLVQHDLSGKKWRLLNTSLRDLARFLAGSRDASVRLSTWDAIFRSDTKGCDSSSAVHLRDALLRQRDATFEACISKKLWEAIAVDLDQIGLQGVEVLAAIKSQKILEHGLKICWERFHRLKERADYKRSGSSLHEWRKTVKHLRYQRLIFPEFFDGAHGKIDTALKNLADLLGTDRDVAMLRSWISDLPTDGPLSKSTRKSLQNEMRALQLRTRDEIFGRSKFFDL